MKIQSFLIRFLVFFVLGAIGCSPVAPPQNSQLESSETFSENLPNKAAVDSDSIAKNSEDVSNSNFEKLVESLAVEPESKIKYDRDLFGNWIDEDGNGCNTRKEVLISESKIQVELGDKCSIVSGSWYSEFDGITTTDETELNIDHFVPLSEAWKSGAFQWDNQTRRNFANDLVFEGSLIAVTSSSNLSKGNRDPANWMPENSRYHCQYILDWILVKYRWNLNLDSEELAAINSIASNCDFEELVLSVPESAQIEFSNEYEDLTPLPKEQSELDSCSPGQIDINSATFEDLLEIIHIGEVRAQELILLRPFNSIRDLVRINGIGEARIFDIEAQNLACVSQSE